MVVYIVPGTKYVDQPLAGTPLDEIEIDGPPPQPLQQNSQSSAEFTLHVKAKALTKVQASITFTRYQSFPGGLAANVGPAAGVGTYWTFNLTPAGAAYEAHWVMQPNAPALAVGNSQTFAVNFNTGPTAGTYRLTYRIQAQELNSVETTFDMVVA